MEGTFSVQAAPEASCVAQCIRSASINDSIMRLKQWEAQCIVCMCMHTHACWHISRTLALLGRLATRNGLLHDPHTKKSTPHARSSKWVKVIHKVRGGFRGVAGRCKRLGVGSERGAAPPLTRGIRSLINRLLPAQNKCDQEAPCRCAAQPSACIPTPS